MSEIYKECAEALSHWNAAKVAEGKIDRFMPPHLDYNRGLAEAEKQAAETALRAHRMYKCSCVIRAAMEAAKSGAYHHDTPHG